MVGIIKPGCAMKRFYPFCLMLCLLLWLSCGESSDDITGNSRLSGLQANRAEVLADGISQISLIATVLDSSGYRLPGAVVHFTTTAGTITARAYSDDYGQATAILTSSASVTDITAQVTAALVAAETGRSASGILSELQVMNPNVSAPLKLAKTANGATNRATLEIRLIGITLTTQLEAAEISADGMSQTQMRIWLKETSSNRGLAGANCRVRAATLPIFLDILTGANGHAIVPIKSVPQAATDTLFVEYGNLMRAWDLITLLPPRISINPRRTELLADGMSKMTFHASLVSFKNNPIQSAAIFFSTSAGVITGSSITSPNGEALAELRAGTTVGKNIPIIAQFHGWADTAWVDFVDTAPSAIVLLSEKEIIRDGATPSAILATVVNPLQKPVKNALVRFSSSRGTIDSTATTDESGRAVVHYYPDAGETDAEATIRAQVHDKIAEKKIGLLGISLTLAATPGNLPADGLSSATITASLKMTTAQMALARQTISLTASLGSIASAAFTNDQGIAQAGLIASTTAGVCQVRAGWGKIQKTAQVVFTDNKPALLQLYAEPNFIWVRETGHTEQTRVSARIYGSNGQPMQRETAVRFSIRNGPKGGEALLPNEGNPAEASVQKSVAGVAAVTLRSGIRSGTVEIEAVLVDNPEVSARTTQITIRSGPAYIWIDPADPNHVESHMTVALNYFNLEGWNHVRDFEVSIYVGDKYNNPVEQGTAIYLTSTAGIVTTDTRTDAEGRGTALWSTANPRPTIAPGDPTTLAPHRIPNPNSPGTFLPVTVPDFEGSLVRNSSGTLGENDGIGYVLATTQGRDQNGNDAVVYGLNRGVFSGSVLEFRATAARDTLRPGESTIISIRVFDVNGNPVAKGSSLTASVNAGQLSATDLMASAERYGFGTTFFTTSLLNTLDAKIDESKMVDVVFRLDSPNGSGTINTQVYLIGKP